MLRKLGNTDLEITSIGLGAWAIGGTGYAFAWGVQDDQDSVRTIQRALDMGINWIDTAAVYGLGHSEEVVGRALKSAATRPFIFTKCGIRWSSEGQTSRVLNAASIREECEISLKRLDIDVIDLYQIHWPEPDNDIEEGWTEMAKLQEEGKVRFIGVSNFNVSQLKRAQSIAPVSSLQPPYSLIRRDIEREILPYCFEQGIGVIVYSPMASGLLSGGMTKERAAGFSNEDWRSRSDAFREPALSRNLEIAEKLRRVGELYGKSTGETAIAWTLAHPAVTAAIVGMRKPEQVDQLIGAMDYMLGSADLKALE